ncbi:MAG TPA: RelA/SpoT family protein [Candidatus Paceibacterota bacterium]|nr:RelA/SpoT family protein [Candidatus Paceibacterota bacterium]
MKILYRNLRNSQAELQKLFSEMKRTPSEEEQMLLKRAYFFAEKAHDGQKRFSGEPYFNHVYATALNLAGFGADAETIAAGFLHDTLEDTETTKEELRDLFGEKILFLVEGVTKLGTYRYQGVKRHTESLRKLFIASSKDIRVLIIKFADRLHNVSTLRYVRKDKQKRIAMETLEIYAPLANRLGMGKLKGELEEYSFPFAYPEEYEEVKKLLKQKSKAGEKPLQKVYRTLKQKLAEDGLKDAQTSKRIKGVYSLYKKLLRHDMDIDKVYDLIAIRVIVNSVEDCYRVLGIVHGLWRPLPGRIKDYIATPKPNGYQSIHTNIFIGDGGVIEIQIRTQKMHEEAEYGIASHTLYKEGLGRKKGDQLKKNLLWIEELVERQKNVEESGVFLENLKTDFFEDRIFVFTPKNDVIDLPEGSSPIDLAYSIHSDIGDHIVGAKINGKFLSIDTKLKNGDIVEVITKRNARPTEKWMKSTKTALAQRHIRSALQHQKAH